MLFSFWFENFKTCKIQVDLRNNTAPPSRTWGNNTRCISCKRAALYINLIQAPHFRLTGWDLDSPCVQSYHVILLNSRSLYPEFENELRKSACLSSFSKFSSSELLSLEKYCFQLGISLHFQAFVIR